MKESIWLVQAGERLPIDGDPRIMRMGMIAEELHSRGYEVHWFTARFDHAKKLQRTGPERQELRPGYFIHLLEGCSYSSNISVRRIIHQHSVARAFYKKALSLPAPTLIISAHPTPDLSSTAAALAHKLGVKLIVDIRDPWPDMFPGYFSKAKQLLIAPLLKYYRTLLRRAAQQAIAIFAVSEAMLHWGLTYASRSKRETDQVHYIGYQGAPRGELASSRVRPAVLECVFVSTFGQSYDAETVVEAFRELDQKFPQKIHCTFVGEGERRAAIETLAQGMNNVTFTGWLGNTQLSELLKRMDVGIIAVRGGISEFMLPNKLFEYLSYGLAIVNTLPCEAAALLSHVKAGKTVDSGNAPAMAEELARWILQPELVQEMRRNSLRAFVEQFQAERIYREYVNQVENIIRGQFEDGKKYLQV